MSLFDHLVSIVIESYFWTFCENLECQNVGNSSLGNTNQLGNVLGTLN